MEITGDFKQDQKVWYAAAEAEVGRKLTKEEKRSINQKIWREGKRLKRLARKEARAAEIRLVPENGQ